MSSLLKTSFFSKFNKKTKSKNNSGSGKARKILSKISGAFMLPISVMAIAGLFLGVGAAISSNAGDLAGLKTFGSFIEQLGNSVFYILPLLFAVAFVIAFTDEAGVAVFATLIGYVVFLLIQQVFIKPVESTEYLQLVTSEGNKPAWNSISLPDSITSIVDKKEKTEAVDAWVANNGIIVQKHLTGYTVLFGGAGRNPESLLKLVGSTMGITSLQTSVFGGIVVGLVMQYLYNELHTIKLPAAISFFGGKRFVAIAAIPAMAALAILFLIFWPWVGVALNKIGTALGSAKYVDSFVFGYIERSLIPFGLHHVFYAPLWYTEVGGDVEASLNTFTKAATEFAAANNSNELFYGFTQAQVNELLESGNFLAFQKFVAENADKLKGDSTMSLRLISFEKNDIYGIPLFAFISDYLGIRVGRFMDGKFSIMMFGLPAAAVAMVFAAPKENRKVTLGTVIPAATTSFITGVTEPIEFTFLFLSPFLFWGFHAFMAATSFLVANLLGTHIPMAFSGGALDMVIYGAINVQKGTHFWWPLVVGPAYAIIYFGFFYWFIKWKNLDTPGRGGNTKLFTKADVRAAKDSKSSVEGVDQKSLDIVAAMGGVDNITAFNNCASRLRYDVKDKSKVSVDGLKAAGAYGVQFVGENHVQAIFGTEAEQINASINKNRDAIASALAKNPELLSRTETETIEAVHEAMEDDYQELVNPVQLNTVARGKIIPIAEVEDQVFSSKAMGDGFAVKFSSEKVGNVYSPVDGEVTLVFPSKHAYGITTKDGVQLLIHIGIDTVGLQGEGFKSLVAQGDKVTAGQPVAEVDLELLKSKGLITDAICVVLNEGKHNRFSFTNSSFNADSTTTLVGEVK